jgi:small GTP-binding protein
MASPAEDAGDVEKHREFLYKVLVIGDIGVGKTSIIKRYVHGIFSAHYKSTIGVDFALKVINWDPNTTVRLQLWDIAGQERFGNMTRVYYKEAVGAFIVFDVTRVATFEAVQKWKSDVETKVTIPGTEQPIPVVLLANKIDLAKEEFAKNREQMDQFCRENNFVGWFETSAKDNVNIDKASAMLVQSILENVKHVQEIEKPKDSGVVTLTSDQPKTEQKDNCNC